MTDLTILRTRLTQAEEAYHQLQIGAKAVEMMMNGRKVVYTPADSPKLKTYISELKTGIDSAEGTKKTSKKPIYFNLS